MTHDCINYPNLYTLGDSTYSWHIIVSRATASITYLQSIQSTKGSTRHPQAIEVILRCLPAGVMSRRILQKVVVFAFAIFLVDQVLASMPTSFHDGLRVLTRTADPQFPNSPPSCPICAQVRNVSEWRAGGAGTL
jgi:hypothetical protein